MKTSQQLPSVFFAGKLEHVLAYEVHDQFMYVVFEQVPNTVNLLTGSVMILDAVGEEFNTKLITSLLLERQSTVGEKYDGFGIDSSGVLQHADKQHESGLATST